MLESDYNGYKVRLVENLHDLKVMCSHLHPKIKVGVDTETKSLTYAPDSVAGICISCGRSYHPSEYAGYYIPLRHINYENNLPIPKVMKVVQNIVDKCVTVWWNRNFDLSMLEYDGLKVPYIGHMQDGQIMAHLAFSESYPALKDTTQKVLKFKVLEFSSNKAENNNFMTTDPRVSYIYASQDPLVTVLTSQKIWNDYPYIRKIYPLDNKALEAVRRLSATEIFLDFKFLKGILGEEQAKLRKYREECIEIAGYPFNVNSSQEKADALSRFVSLTKKTASGKWKVDDETLSTIDHPLAAALVRYSKQRTYMSSFLEKMCKFDDGEPIRVNYSSVNVQCLTEDNLVLTSKGLVKANEVKVGDKLWTRVGLRRVINQTKFEDSCIRVSFQNGLTIEGNLQHPVLVNNEWVELKDLKIKDKVQLQEFIPFWERQKDLPKAEKIYKQRTTLIQPLNTVEWARILGFIDGDGSLVSDGVKFCWSALEPEMEKYYKDFIKMIGWKETKPYLGQDNSVQVKVCSTQLSRYLASLGIKSHGHESGIDISYFDSDQSKAYVAAIFDTDGSVNKSSRNYNIRLSMASFEIVTNVAKILRSLGIDTYVWYEEGRNKKSLRVRGVESVLRFCDVISPYMICVHKVERLKEVREYFRTKTQRMKGAVVSKVELTGTKVVYGFEVEEVHEFVANGLINHNTGRLSSGGAGGNKFFRPINGQNIPKVEVKGYIHPSEEFGYIVDEDPHNCVSEDSLVSTPNGEKKISLISEGDEVLASKGYQKVTKKWTSKKPVMRINLQDGKFIECSPEHRIKVIRNSMKLWVPAVCILPTDHIVTVDE